MKPSDKIELPERMRDPATLRLFAALTAGGVEARFVGGCVRDAVLGSTSGNIDIDMAVSAPPATVMRALQAAKIKTVPTGLKHGTVTAIVDGRPYELTTLRRDVETDGRRAVVAFTDDWLEDAERRDFTFNALYADPDGTLYDPFDGRADLAAGKVRFIGDADRRIDEDHLRIMRFFRFHAWYGRAPFDGPSFDACRRNVGTLVDLSGERIAKELLRTLLASAAADAMDAMFEAGVFAHWLPEYVGSQRLRGLIEREPTPDALRRLGAVLPEDGVIAVRIGKRLRRSTQEEVRLGLMVLREPRVGMDLKTELYRMGKTVFVDRVLLQAPDNWRDALKLARDWTPPELPVSGRDVLSLGLAPGPKVGRLMTAVEDWWVAGDFTADRAACLAELERLAKHP
jgi:poly(A) polymerase